MLMAVEGPYALMVQPDDILISPREVDEHFGTMACFHPRYALGDSHRYMEKDDFLREMYLDTVGHDEAGLKRYEHMVNIVSSRFRHGPKTEERAVDDAMLKVISEKYITLPLYLMDHSGLAMQTTSFNDPWDSGQVGWIYVSKEDALKEFAGEKMTGALRKICSHILTGILQAAHESPAAIRQLAVFVKLKAVALAPQVGIISGHFAAHQVLRLFPDGAGHFFPAKLL